MERSIAWLAAIGVVVAALAVPPDVPAGAAGADPVALATDVKERLDRAPAPPAAVIAWYVDESTGQVVVEADPAALPPAADFVKASGVAAAAVRVEASTERPVLQYNLRGGDGWGTGLSDGCSIGFSVSRITAPDVRGFVTAGHCGTAGRSTFANVDGARIPQGVIRGSTFPGRDHAWVEVNEDWTPLPLVNQYGSGNTIVTGWREAPVGGQVCRSGIATQLRCGTIQTKDVTVNFSAGPVTGLTRTNACAANGDSGGPYLTGQQAQGIHVASSGNCTSGGRAYFQPLVPILATYNLRVLTSGTGGTPPVIRNMNCEFIGNFLFLCLLSYYHPDGVQIRWKVDGVDRPAWNNLAHVTGGCGTGSTGISVTVTNSSGTATASRSVRCEGEPQ